jgi:hypothetical protein
LRRGFEFLGFAFEGASYGFQLIGQFEACDPLRQAKAPLGFTAQCSREPRRFLFERGLPAR